MTAEPAVRPRDGVLDFVVETRGEDDGTWTAWVRDRPDVTANAADRASAVSRLVDAVVDAALGSYRVVEVR